MEPERLERLLLDDALGVLSDDVQALLAEHIGACGGTAAAEAEAYRRTVGLARRAMRQESPERLPALPAARIRADGVALRRRRWAGRIAALAACVLIGVGLGYLAFKGPMSAGPGGVQIQMVAGTGGPVAAAPGVRGFWSIARLAGAAAEDLEPNNKVTWFSGGPQPRKGGGS